jgi:uncharacterized membrane-anchored protein
MLLFKRFVTLFALLGLSIATPVIAQDSKLQDLHWETGPKAVDIGDHLAQLKLTKQQLYLGKADTAKVLEYLKEPVNSQNLGMIVPNTSHKEWTVYISYDPMGYVKDDDAGEIDADALLKEISEGTEESNKERSSPLHVVGWKQKPIYDKKTHHLVWAIIASSDGTRILNYNTRILGRSGVTSINLVVDENQFDRYRSKVDEVISGYSYIPEKRYEAFVPGKDTVAEVGLAALILGGAGVAAKTGVLAKVGLFLLVILKKAWLLLLAGPLAWFKGLFGKKKSDQATQPSSTNDGNTDS